MANLARISVTVFLVGLLLVGLVFIGNSGFCSAQVGTFVKGIISMDSIWTRSGSPYNLTGNVAVDQGVKLTIEPGVIVNLNSYYIRVNGTFVARGNVQEFIRFVGGSISFTSLSADWNSASGVGSVIEYAVVGSYLGLGSSSPLISRNTITAPLGAGSGSPVISKNTIAITTPSDWLGRPSYRSVALSVQGDALIFDNVISGDLDNTAVSIEEGSALLERNLISNRYGFGGSAGYGQSGITVSGDASPTIRQNTIMKCAVGISIADRPRPTITNNNIVDITNYYLRMYSRSVDVNVANNWWGTSDSAMIDQKIFDFADDFELGKVNYVPFLKSENELAVPNLDAPLPTPSEPSRVLTPASSASASTFPSINAFSPTPATTSQLTPIPTAKEQRVQLDPTWVFFASIAIVAVVAAFFLGKKIGQKQT